MSKKRLKSDISMQVYTRVLVEWHKVCTYRYVRSRVITDNLDAGSATQEPFKINNDLLPFPFWRC
ncbi:hypothetical protein B0T13DRAFT_453178 [Neurospora crassa]|nr:hypothetical protein B0T13DRAFT_453178 [Neurospora crassa]